MLSKEYLFTYGTLRDGSICIQSRYLRQHSTYRGRGVLRGDLYDIGGYPGVIVPGFAPGYVNGDVYELAQPATILKYLDLYEECSEDFPEPHEYIRQKLPVRLDDGEDCFCWVYIYNQNIDQHLMIASGDYLAYLQKPGYISS